jgi:T-complex protein 1 subunit eta
VGDDTTSVVLLAGEFLKQVKAFVEEGLHPSVIIRVLRKAVQMTVEKINSLAVKVHVTFTIHIF